MNDKIFDMAESVIVQYAGSDEWAFTDDELKKFAELIVKECAAVCDQVYEETDNIKIRIGAAFCREDIKQHFGVE